MDPIGLSLENYDAVGSWRDTERDNTPIDASALAADGAKFEGPSGLRAALMRRPELFVETVASKLLTYGLGRGLDHHDAPAVRAITQQAARHDYSFSSLLLGVVNSVPFQWREAAKTSDAGQVASR
jgi:hypothetical protein